MSILIDRFMTYEFDTKTEINGIWYIAKPLMMSTPILTRMVDAWNVLRGKHMVLHYKSEENTHGV